MLLVILFSLSIPNDSPIMANLEYLQVRGLIDLPIIRPYELSEIIRKFDELLIEDVPLNKLDKKVIAYFSPLLTKPHHFYHLVHLANLYQYEGFNKYQLYSGIADIRFAGNLHNLISYQEAVRIRLANELDSLGPRGWHNFQAYLNEGLLSFKDKGIRFDVGRCNLLLGPGEEHSLLLSQDPQGYDGYLGQVQSNALEFYNIFSILENRRYLAIHRIGLNLKKQLKFGFSEAILFGQELELLYLNPFLPYYLSQWGKGRDDNIMWCFDAAFSVRHSIIYGEFLIDDYMYEDDPYPNKLGYQFGIKTSCLANLLLKFNYAFVDKWVYTHKIPINTYEKDGMPLGFPRGNDVDKLSLHAKYWTGYGLNPILSLVFSRKGQGSIFLPYEEEGGTWTPPFPSGVVEENLEAKLGIEYPLKHHLYFRINIGKRWLRNYQHINNNSLDGIIFNVNLWVLS